jgi:hypothetical protein
MAVGIFFLLILIPLIFCIPILIGIYVYRDANKRGMNAVLWTLIALLTPSMLGLIIYLLVRSNYSDLTCPNCNSPVEESYVVCPTCRTKLRPTCEVCGTAVQTTWKVCPHCGTDLPEYDYSVATPVRKKDNTLGKILVAILVIPIAILILLSLLTIPFSANKMSGFGSSGVTSMTLSEFTEDLTEGELLYYKEMFEIHPTTVDNQDYHLFYYDGGYRNDVYEYQYLIYIPNAGEPLNISYHDTREGKLFKKANYLNFDILCDKTGSEGAIFIYSYEGTQEPPEYIRINYNGKEVELTPDVQIGTPFLPTKFDYPVAITH